MRADILFADRQARQGTMPIWPNGKNGKEYRATLGHKPIGGIFSVGVEEKYRWKDSVQSEAEIRLWVADGIANDLRPWFTKFGGVLYDQRWLKPVEEIYTWHAQNERYLRNERPLARVALVYSQLTAAFYGGEQARAKVEDHTLGWYQALIEARIPFEMVHDGLLDADHVDCFKTLILPNIAVLSDTQCQQLRDYVARGGNLIATFETSLYDEQGQRRSTFGLADLFGVDVTGTVEAPMQNSYLRLERDPTTGDFHPLLTGIIATERIINGVQRLPVEAREPVTNAPLTLIPSYPDLPMEEVYPRTDHTGIPEVYLRQLGKSRVVYFPWDVDRTFWEVLCVDHGKLLANAVMWATDEAPPVTVTGPGVLDVTVWQQAASLTVHLVNLTNAMFMKGPVRELLPVGEQTVRVQLPAGKSAQQVQLLRSAMTPVWQVVEGILQVTVPTVVDHEVVAIDF
ncbi:MAG: beta-galactosidase trimerization domain-containing protein [Caldilineaceae bacterium]